MLCLQGLFNFKPSVRPVPLECHIQVWRCAVCCTVLRCAALRCAALFVHGQQVSAHSLSQHLPHAAASANIRLRSGWSQH